MATKFKEIDFEKINGYYKDESKENRMFINERNDGLWVEYQKNQLHAIFQFVLQDKNNGDVLLYDSHRDIYLKLSDTEIRFGYNKIENILHFLINGKWMKKPVMMNRSAEYEKELANSNGYWIDIEDRKIINKNNDNFWIEYQNNKQLAVYEFSSQEKNGDVIILDASRQIYLKLSNNKIWYGYDNIENINTILCQGRWVKKPEIKRKSDQSTTEFDFFMSHQKESKSIVVDKCEWLTSKGYKIWLDRFQLNVGDELHTKLAEGILNSEYFIAFITKSYIESYNCQLEYKYAISKKKPAIFILLEDVDIPPGLDIYMSNSMRLDAYKESGPLEHLNAESKRILSRLIK